MSRIKFLDVLEETKNKPVYDNFQDSRPTNTNSEESLSRRERLHNTDIPRRTPRNSSIDMEQPIRNSYTGTRNHLREDMGTRDRSLAYETGYAGKHMMSENNNRLPVSHQQSAHNHSEIDNRMLWTGALFVLFGGMLFLSGYWVGQTIKGNVKSDREMLVSSSLPPIQSVGNTDSSAHVKPAASTLDTIPVASKPMKVIEPSIAETPKPSVAKAKPKPVVSNKEYIVQVSAHSTIDSARIVEDKLRSAGFEAYTSESAIGDAVFFRVRIRGFKSKDAAQQTLSEIKRKNLGTDGFVLTLE